MPSQPDASWSNAEIEKWAKPRAQIIKKTIDKTKELIKEIGKMNTEAAEREKFIKGVKEGGFIKIFEGVSDALKKKCLPKNQATKKVLEDWKKKVSGRASSLMQCGTYAQTAIDDTSAQKVLAAKSLSRDFDAFVVTYADFDRECREACDKAIKAEADAVKVLEQYLSGKKIQKQQSPEAYKEFKKYYENLAKTL